MGMPKEAPKETPPAPRKPAKFKFSDLQSRAVIESSWAKEIADKYASLVQSRVAELSQQASLLRKQAKEIEQEIVQLKHEESVTTKTTNDNYSSLLKMIVSSFETPPPPWKAALKIEDGVPTGVELLPDKG